VKTTVSPTACLGSKTDGNGSLLGAKRSAGLRITEMPSSSSTFTFPLNDSNRTPTERAPDKAPWFERACFSSFLLNKL